MLFHVVGIVFGFLPGVSFPYNQCLLQSEGEEKGPSVTPRLLAHSATAVCRDYCCFLLGFSHLPPETPFLSKLEAVGPWDTSA